MSVPQPLTSEDQDIHKIGPVSSSSALPGRDASMMTPNSSLTDLQRFLQEVGTNTREARYWLKHFQRTTNKLFAVMHIQEEVIRTPALRQSLCSCLAFLHRHQMRMVLIHGPTKPAHPNDLQQAKAQRQQITEDCVALCDSLEVNGAPARPLMPGCQIFQVGRSSERALEKGVRRQGVSGVEGVPRQGIFSGEDGASKIERYCLDIDSVAQKFNVDLSFQSEKHVVTTPLDDNKLQNKVDSTEGINGIDEKKGEIPVEITLPVESQGKETWGIEGVNVKLVEWGICSGHVVIIPSVGETEEGRLVHLAAEEATAHISKHLQPLKVLLVNDRGGLHDEADQVVPVIRLPNDLQTIATKPWYTSELATKIHNISELLGTLSPQSSVVIVSASRLLPELFTHRGSGTFFKITEGVQSYTDLSDVDVHSLVTLIEQGFERKLKDTYMPELTHRLHSLYIIDGYTAAAVLTMETKIPVPYLDKFVVCTSRQGESSGQTLWDLIKKDHPCLFWRSRKDNPINTWYFHRSSGSRTMGKWIVFWYGDVSESLSSQMIDYALKLPGSFNEEPFPIEELPISDNRSPVYEAVSNYKDGLRMPIIKQRSTEALIYANV